MFGSEQRRQDDFRFAFQTDPALGARQLFRRIVVQMLCEEHFFRGRAHFCGSSLRILDPIGLVSHFIPSLISLLSVLVATAGGSKDETHSTMFLHLEKKIK